MTEENLNSQFEAYCDRVFAIAITLLAIDITLPSDRKGCINYQHLICKRIKSKFFC